MHHSDSSVLSFRVSQGPLAKGVLQVREADQVPQVVEGIPPRMHNPWWDQADPEGKEEAQALKAHLGFQALQDYQEMMWDKQFYSSHGIVVCVFMSLIFNQFHIILYSSWWCKAYSDHRHSHFHLFLYIINILIICLINVCAFVFLFFSSSFL